MASEKIPIETLVQELNIPRNVILEIFSIDKIYHNLNIPDLTGKFRLYHERSEQNITFRKSVYEKIKHYLTHLTAQEEFDLRNAIKIIKERAAIKMKRYALRNELSRFSDGHRMFIARITDLGQFSPEEYRICIDHCHVYETGEAALKTKDDHHMWITIPRRDGEQSPKENDWITFIARPYIYGKGPAANHAWSLGHILRQNWRLHNIQVAMDWWKSIKFKRYLSKQYI